MGSFYHFVYNFAVENGELVTKRKRELIHYEYQPVQRFISHLAEQGYDCHQLNEGTLLIGDWICIPPYENGKYFVIREHFQTAWSGYMTVEPKRKLSARELAELENEVM